MLTKIPVGYSGATHWLLINLSVLGGIALCVVAIDAPQWWEWLFLPGFFVFANGFEWWIHRGPMHHPTAGLRMLYQGHTLEHHVFFPDDDMAVRDSRERYYVLFPPFFLPAILLVNLPIPLLLGGLVAPNLAWFFLLSALAYYLVYEWMHFMHHLRRDSWLGKRSLVARLRTHHTRHHELRRMNKGNFNVSFPLWDWLLGTILPANSQAATREPASRSAAQ